MSPYAESLKCNSLECTADECCTTPPGISATTDGKSDNLLIQDVEKLKQDIKKLREDVDLLNINNKSSTYELVKEGFENRNNHLFFLIVVIILIYFLITHKK